MGNVAADGKAVTGAAPSPRESRDAPPPDFSPGPGEEAGDEGRAMLQILHDLAPHAHLAFATAFESEESFAKNIEALAEANRIAFEGWQNLVPRQSEILQDSMVIGKIIIPILMAFMSRYLAFIFPILHSYPE